MKQYEIKVENLVTNEQNTMRVDNFQIANCMFEIAKEIATRKEMSVIISVFGTFGELIETTTINPRKVIVVE